MIKISLKFLAISFIFSLSHAENSLARSDSHGPIGVMREHVHKKGEIMLSYRFQYMHMRGLRDGTDKVTTAAALKSGYMSVPTKMVMKMHMIGSMYGVTDNFTVAVMGSLFEKSMDNQNKMTGGFKREVDGIGDVFNEWFN